MDKRSNLINQYYTDLDYIILKDCKQRALMHISDLSRQINCEGDDFSSRAFMPKYHDLPLEKYKKSIWTIMLSLFNDCDSQREIELFLETSIIKKSSLDNHLYREYKQLLSCQTVEIILLEDADLFAVISYLKIPGNSRYLNKIWVPEQIKRNFLSFIDKYFQKYLFIRFPIRIFQSKQNLLTPPTPYKINIASIWSEDIVAAENLAVSLDRNIVLINTLDFSSGTVLMPYVEIFKVPSHKQFLHSDLDEDQYIISTIKPISTKKAKPKAPAKLIYDFLFYDGMWQKPVNDTYWTDEENTRANATSEDIARCVLSARKGFKIWSTWSTESRMQVLSKYASVLEHNGEFELSKLISKWLKFPYWYQFHNTDVLLPNVQHDAAVLKRIHEPKGIITLMEERETDLFRKLIQSLVIGNSVIVVCTANSCNITSYYDIFSTSGMPPGVANLLSCENIKPLSDCYTATDLGEMYTQYTKMKQILVSISLETI